MLRQADAMLRQSQADAKWRQSQANAKWRQTETPPDSPTFVGALVHKLSFGCAVTRDSKSTLDAQQPPHQPRRPSLDDPQRTAPGPTDDETAISRPRTPPRLQASAILRVPCAFQRARRPTWPPVDESIMAMAANVRLVARRISAEGHTHSGEAKLTTDMAVATDMATAIVAPMVNAATATDAPMAVNASTATDALVTADTATATDAPMVVNASTATDTLMTTDAAMVTDTPMAVNAATQTGPTAEADAAQIVTAALRALLEEGSQVRASVAGREQAITALLAASRAAGLFPPGDAIASQWRELRTRLDGLDGPADLHDGETTDDVDCPPPTPSTAQAMGKPTGANDVNLRHEQIAWLAKEESGVRCTEEEECVVGAPPPTPPTPPRVRTMGRRNSFERPSRLGAPSALQEEDVEEEEGVMEEQPPSPTPSRAHFADNPTRARRNSFERPRRLSAPCAIEAPPKVPARQNSFERMRDRARRLGRGTSEQLHLLAAGALHVTRHGRLRNAPSNTDAMHRARRLSV